MGLEPRAYHTSTLSRECIAHPNCDVLTVRYKVGLDLIFSRHHLCGFLLLAMAAEGSVNSKDQLGVDDYHRPPFLVHHHSSPQKIVERII